jgi:hypothetical protein
MMSLMLSVMRELYRRHYLEIYDRRFWVKDLSPKIQEIRRTLQDLKTTTRKQTSFINTVKERLAGEYPARATVQSQRRNGCLHTRGPPAFWAWLAGCGDFLAIRIQSRFNNHYRKEYEHGRVQITELTRQAFSGDLPPALWSNPGWRSGFASCSVTVCSIATTPVFDSFNFGYRERGWILPSNLPL